MIHNFVGRLLLENIYEQICMKNVWWGRGSGEAKSPRNTVVELELSNQYRPILAGVISVS
jgi:hypothetical protein